jgi:glutamate carboxypeptidase
MPDFRLICARDERRTVDVIRDLAEAESPSTDRVALEACATRLVSHLTEDGAAITRVDADPTARHVLAEWPGAGPRVLMLGHFDTVWPVGQLARMPIREDAGQLYGPGVLDMKGGLAIALAAIRALVAEVPRSRRPHLTFLVTSDEEVGSATSRSSIERLARESAAVLVFEPALPGGAVKTSRKGVGEFEIVTHGISAHAGVDPAAGASAIRELVHQIAAVDGWSDPALGLTVNVGVVEGGTRSNVVPERARAVVDVRVSRLEDAGAIERRFAALRPRDPRVRLEVHGRVGRPPMERAPGVARLYELARDVGRAMGYELAEGATGGASDGNFTAALGVPTLDGLGATGDGPHALHEHVIIKDLPIRAALVAGLLARIGDNGI